ncbi:hypothetical protein [Actimicrobium antarcticum]|uniref:hypothetical protein n=1 Tax=Actimicrobium antarcticum TaxID=1051899 RepID=UPI0031D946E8
MSGAVDFYHGHYIYHGHDVNHGHGRCHRCGGYPAVNLLRDCFAFATAQGIWKFLNGSKLYDTSRASHPTELAGLADAQWHPPRPSVSRGYQFDWAAFTSDSTIVVMSV